MPQDSPRLESRTRHAPPAERARAGCEGGRRRLPHLDADERLQGHVVRDEHVHLVALRAGRVWGTLNRGWTRCDDGSPLCVCVCRMRGVHVSSRCRRYGTVSMYGKYGMLGVHGMKCMHSMCIVFTVCMVRVIVRMYRVFERCVDGCMDVPLHVSNHLFRESDTRGAVLSVQDSI